MLNELRLWLYETLSGLFFKFGRGLLVLWRFIVGQIRVLGWARGRLVLASAPLLFLVYILIGMMIVHRIGDDTNVRIDTPTGASNAVAVVSYLTDREVNQHSWTPNDPFIYPGWWLDNLPNFQKGMIGALSRFTFELRDQLGRMRGSSAVDVNLEKAAGNLSKEPDRWVIDWKTSFLPTTPSDTYFKEAIKHLNIYNGRLVSKDAAFERRSDNLLATLDRIALDLGASSAAIDSYIREEAGGFLPDFGADDLFYQIKGQVYAYLMLLEALRLDFDAIIESRDLAPLYGELTVSLKAAAILDPLLVTNGSADGFLANHLSVQGFYLLRARTQMREITNILLK